MYKRDGYEIKCSKDVSWFWLSCRIFVWSQTYFRLPHVMNWALPIILLSPIISLLYPMGCPQYHQLKNPHLYHS